MNEPEACDDAEAPQPIENEPVDRPLQPSRRRRQRSRRDSVAWVLFVLSGLGALLACVIAALDSGSGGGASPMRAALEHAGASPAGLLAISTIALVGGLCLRRVTQLESVFRDVGESHEALLEKNEALQQSLEEVKRHTDLARAERFSAQLDKVRTELATLRSELETRVLPAPEVRRAFEEQGNKFADLGKFLHRLRTEWLEGMRAAMQPLARQTDLAPVQADVRALVQWSGDVPKASQLDAASDETRGAVRDVAARIATMEEDLAKTESHFGSIESYLGSVSERIEGSFRDMRTSLDEDRKRRPVDFRDEWARVQVAQREEWNRGLSEVREDLAHRKEEIRHEIRTAIADSEKELRSVLSSIEWLRNRLEALPDPAAPLGTVREALDAQRQAITELRQTFGQSQETLAELSHRIGDLPGELKGDFTRANTDVEREFAEVRRRFETRLAAIEEFRGGITGLTEETRRIREAIREVEASLQALRSQPDPAFVATPATPVSVGTELSAKESIDAAPVVASSPTAAVATAAAPASPGATESVFSAIEKLRSMMGS
ncbi:MAG: hypothetical protein HYR85_02455 [Planctomycetes bacterium]|nr:hypothetical protein [Planctomycetota bacterium]MBI3846883.1 hypothetical protein [Planctomycetota bacterium]